MIKSPLSPEKLFCVIKRCTEKTFEDKYFLIFQIKILRRIHRKGLLHRDIKPENFVIGAGSRRRSLYIIDFGMSKHYVVDNRHIPYKENKTLTGTARYASINTHKGIRKFITTITPISCSRFYIPGDSHGRNLTAL